MKKSLILFYILFLAVLSFTACSSKTDDNISTKFPLEQYEVNIPTTKPEWTSPVDNVPKPTIEENPSEVEETSDCLDATALCDGITGIVESQDASQELGIPDNSTVANDASNVTVETTSPTVGSPEIKTPLGSAVVSDDSHTISDATLPVAEYPEKETPDSALSTNEDFQIPQETLPDTVENSEVIPSVDSLNTENNNEENDAMINECQLIVRGQSLSQGKYMQFSDTPPRHVLVPLTAILQELGAVIEWKTDTIAQIQFNNKNYTLDTIGVYFLEDVSGLNLIIPTPGGKICSQPIQCELLLDHMTLRTVALMLGITVKINVDYLEQIVVIDYA